MNWDTEYRSAYEAKKKPEGVYIMNQFCSSIEKDATIKDIPDILKLYDDRALTWEQNEFVTEVLCTIVENNPRDAAKNIIANIRILQEEAEECFIYILIIFIHWYPQFKNIFLEELKESNIENQKYIIDNIEDRAHHLNDEKFIEFLKEYRL